MRGGRSIREAYEEHFDTMDGREIRVHRVVNIVDKRNSMHRDYNRGFNEDPWYDAPRNYPNKREYYTEDERDYYTNDNFPQERFFDDAAGFRRNHSPPRNVPPHHQQGYDRHDLRHQIGSRKRGRGGPNVRGRGRGSGPRQSSTSERKSKSLHSHQEDRSDHKVSAATAVKRDRSPASKEAPPAVRSGSSTSNGSFSPDKDEGQQPVQKKHRPSVPPSHTPSSVEGSPRSAESSKVKPEPKSNIEKPSASVAETEEVVAASTEPKVTPDEDFRTRRSEAIKAKALEIEEQYRKDCETFCVVVKMLVAKQPSLDNLLQAPLDENLLEIKRRYLDDLKHFVKDLDEPFESAGRKTQK